MTMSEITVVDGDHILTGHPDAIRQYLADMERQRQRQARKLELWGPEKGTGRMTRLCRLFPSFEEAEGIDPWSVDRLLTWSFSGAPTGGTWHAIRFVLQVWNAQTDWPAYLMGVATRAAPATDPEDQALWNRLQAYQRWIREELKEQGVSAGRLAAKVEELLKERLKERFAPFNVVAALSAWDEKHAAAFLAWCEAPFWP